MTRYYTNFKLTNAVNDIDAARAYLTEDDMTQFIRPDIIADGVIEHVEWVLDDAQNGHVDVLTRRPLTEAESKRISDWIRGQNSDGLGEGFEQQEFACCWEEEDDEEDDPRYPDEWVAASFDWETNDYPLTRVDAVEPEEHSEPEAAKNDTSEEVVKKAFALYKEANDIRKKAEALLADAFSGMQMCQCVDDFNIDWNRLQVYKGIDGLIKAAGVDYEEDERYIRCTVGGIKFYEVK